MRKEVLYKTFENEKMILRDCLATDRTLLANERTYLAYIRTMVNLLAAGIGLIKFVDGGLSVQILGCFLMVGSAVTFYYGTMRFFKTKDPLEKLLS